MIFIFLPTAQNTEGSLFLRRSTEHVLGSHVAATQRRQWMISAKDWGSLRQPSRNRDLDGLTWFIYILIWFLNSICLKYICIIFPCSTMFRTLIPICLRCCRWLEPRGLIAGRFHVGRGGVRASSSGDPLVVSTLLEDLGQAAGWRFSPVGRSDVSVTWISVFDMCWRHVLENRI